MNGIIAVVLCQFTQSGSFCSQLHQTDWD